MQFTLQKPKGKYIKIRIIGHQIINCVQIVYVLPIIVLYLIGTILGFGTLEIGE